MIWSMGDERWRLGTVLLNAMVVKLARIERHRDPVRWRASERHEATTTRAIQR
jgi:hypothetical protein